MQHQPARRGVTKTFFLKATLANPPHGVALLKKTQLSPLNRRGRELSLRTHHPPPFGGIAGPNHHSFSSTTSTVMGDKKVGQRGCHRSAGER